MLSLFEPVTYNLASPEMSYRNVLNRCMHTAMVAGSSFNQANNIPIRANVYNSVPYFYEIALNLPHTDGKRRHRATLER